MWLELRGLGGVEMVKDEIGSVTQGQERNGLKNQAYAAGLYPILKGKTSEIFQTSK